MLHYDGFEDKYYTGRRPNGIYIPRFQNIGGKTKNKNFSKRIWLSRWSKQNRLE